MYCPSVAVMKESPKGGMKVDGHFIPEGTAISVCCKISIISAFTLLMIFL